MTERVREALIPILMIYREDREERQPCCRDITLGRMILITMSMMRPKVISRQHDTYYHEYDEVGNIVLIAKADTGKVTYEYDSLNQLIREDNEFLGKTICYTYDLGGNMTSRREYALTSGSVDGLTPSKTDAFTYRSSVLVGAAAGAVISGITSAVSQVIFTGTIDPKTVLCDSMAGALSGALAVTGIGRYGQMFGNAIISAGNYIVSNGDDITIGGIVQSTVLGGIGGFIGGDGIDLEYQTSVIKHSQSVVNSFISPKKVAMYSAKIATAKSTISSGIRLFVKSTLVTSTAGNLMNLLAPYISPRVKEMKKKWSNIWNQAKITFQGYIKK